MTPKDEEAAIRMAAQRQRQAEAARQRQLHRLAARANAKRIGVPKDKVW